MKGFISDIESKTFKNEYFRQVLFTAKNMQLVVMSLKPGEDIGVEIHETVDQFFRIEDGEGQIVMSSGATPFKSGDAFIVTQGTEHNVINTSNTKALKLYTIYTPPNHRDGVIHATKQAAETDTTDIP